MSGSHDHDGHDHGGHAHDHHGRIEGNERAVAIAAGLTGVFLIAEVIGGLVSGSLALLADAGHMLTDMAALGLSWFAFRLARRPADWKRTYGFDRFSVLAAFVNGIALFVIAVWIVVEAIHRLNDPGEVMGGLMLGVAVAGLVVNALSFWILQRTGTENLNVRAAALHVLGDLLGSVAAIAAALVIMTTGWTPIDPLLSVLVSVIILRSAWAVVRDSSHVLLEAAPSGFDTRDACRRLGEIEGVRRVHHMHVWSITEDRVMATLEAVVDAGVDAEATRVRIKDMLAQEMGVGHATVEIARG